MSKPEGGGVASASSRQVPHFSHLKSRGGARPSLSRGGWAIVPTTAHISELSGLSPNAPEKKSHPLRWLEAEMPGSGRNSDLPGRLRRGLRPAQVTGRAQAERLGVLKVNSVYPLAVFSRQVKSPTGGAPTVRLPVRQGRLWTAPPNSHSNDSKRKRRREKTRADEPSNTSGSWNNRWREGAE